MFGRSTIGFSTTLRPEVRRFMEEGTSFVPSNLWRPLTVFDSDGTLNPSGIRFGSAEIYSIVESPHFNNVLSDTLCVGRKRSFDRDETVFLFVKMRPGHELTDTLRGEIEVCSTLQSSRDHTLTLRRLLYENP